MVKIIVQDTEITVSNVNGEDYICITDMLKAKDGDKLICLSNMENINAVCGRASTCVRQN